MVPCKRGQPSHKAPLTKGNSSYQARYMMNRDSKTQLHCLILLIKALIHDRMCGLPRRGSKIRKRIEQEEFEDTTGGIKIRKLKRTDNTMAKRKRTKGQTMIYMSYLFLRLYQIIF